MNMNIKVWFPKFSLSHGVISKIEKHPSEVFCKKGVLKNVTNFKGLRLATLLKRDSDTGVFL